MCEVINLIPCWYWYPTIRLKVSCADQRKKLEIIVVNKALTVFKCRPIMLQVAWVKGLIK